MAGLNLPTLKIDILADGSGAIKEIKSVQDAALEMTRIGGQMTKFTTVPIVTAIAAAVKAAGDFTETLGKTEVVFGGMTDSVMEWSESAVDAMGMAQSTALEMASTYGDMATGMGMAAAESASMSMNLTQLAADIASFKNKGLSEVNTALMGIFTGETESLKQLGIVMTQANLQQFALTQGISENITALSQAEQVQLRYAYVMAQSANAQGDFARTGESLNNRVRKLTETLKELANSYGSRLTEQAANLIGKLQQGVQYLAELDDGAKDTILTIGLIVAAAGPLLLVGGKVLTLVMTLKTSLLALAANPVELGLLGAVAALSALVAVANNAGEGLDKTSKTYQNLKKAIEGGTTGSITINADAQGALDEAQAILDQLNSGDYDGMIAIDGDPEKAEAALAELEAAVNAAKASITVGADGSAVIGANGELERLQAAIDAVNGLIVITEDPAAKAQLELYIAQLKQDLQALGIEVTFTETDETALNIQAFKDKLAGLPKDETYSATGEFKVTEATADTIQKYSEALAAAATATHDYADAVSNLDSIVDQETARKVAEVNAQIAEDAQYLSGLVTIGAISEEEANATLVRTIDAGYEKIALIEKEAEARKKLNETYDNGERADDAPTAASALMELYKGAELTDEQVAGSGQRLVDSYMRGEIGDIQSQIDAKVQLNKLQKEAVETQKALISATEEYDRAMTVANVNEQAALSNAQEGSDRAQTTIEALQHYQDLLQSSFNPQEAISETMIAYEGAFEQFEGLQEDLMSTIQGEDGEGLDYMESLQAMADAVEMQENYQQQITAATEEAVATQKEAISELNAEIQTLTETYALSDYQGVFALIEAAGIAITDMDRQFVEGAETAVASLASALSEGTNDIQSAINTALGAVGTAGSATGKSEGEGIGKDITAGVAAGIASGTSAAESAARASARAVTAAYKAELDIHSPSGVAKREVDNQWTAGVAEGIIEGTPAILAAVKSSTGAIVSSATGVINNGAYTVPMMAAAAPAPQEMIDYDRLAAAMAQRPIAFSVGADEMAVATRDAASRQQALRVRELNAGYGIKGEIR